MVSFKIDQASVNAVKAVIADLGGSINKELRIAIGKTSKQVKIKASRKLREQIQAPVKILKKVVQIVQDPKDDNLRAVIIMIKGHPIPLKYFNAKQTKHGVSVRVNPNLKRITSVGTFMTKTRMYKGNVFIRQGKKRGPLERQHGPNPSDAYKKAGVKDMATKTARDELPKQVKERIRVLILRAQGKLRGNQK